MLTDYWGLVRAKRADTEEWVEGTYYRRTWISSSNRGKSTISQEVATHFVIIKNSSRSDGSPPESFLEVLPDTICPYTGRKDEEGNKVFTHIESECTVEKLFLGMVRMSYPHSIRSELGLEAAASKPREAEEPSFKIKFVNMKKIEEKLFQYFKNHTILETEDPDEIRKVFQEFLITNAYCRVFKVEDIPDVNEEDAACQQ